MIVDINRQLEVREVGDIPTLTVAEYRERSRWGKLKYRIWRMPFITFIIAPVFYFMISNRLPSLVIGLEAIFIHSIDAYFLIWDYCFLVFLYPASA